MVLRTREGAMEESMSQIVPSAGFTPPCDYSNFADSFDLSLLPGEDLQLTQFTFTGQTLPPQLQPPKVYTTFYSDTPQDKGDLDLGPDFQKLLPPSPEGVYLEVPTSKNYHANSPIGALTPYSPQLLSPNDYTTYPSSEYYPASPELSLYNSTYTTDAYVKKEKSLQIDERNVFELLESPLLDKQIKQESTVDFGTLLQTYPEEETKKATKVQDHQLLREVLRDTSYQKKYNIKPFDLGFVKMEEPEENDLQNCADQLDRERIDPVLTMAIEQMRKDMDSTCQTLGISPDPSQWTQANVLSWLEWTSREFQIPAPVPEQWEITGTSLVCLSEEEFVRRSPQGGETLYARLEAWKATYLEDDLKMSWRPETTSNASSGDISDDEDEEMHPTTPSESKPSPTTTTSSSRPSSGSHIHLWQFLKELLQSPQTHGSCIRWLDRGKGVFKIEDSVKVARLWGKRKNRPAMNYDKLSRSIRQYYKKGIMKKTERSQRLVYQFCHPYCL